MMINSHDNFRTFEDQFHVLFIQIKSFVKIFPGVAHGWAVRYKVDNEEAVKRAEEAQQNMMDWFIEHVK